MAQEIIASIINKEESISNRLQKLKYLNTISLSNKSKIGNVSLGPLFAYCGGLLGNYCDPFSGDTEELRLLVPLLSYISKYAEVDNLFARHSDFKYHLMRACVTCVHVFLIQSKEISKLTGKKKLAGRVRRVKQEESVKFLRKTLGLPTFPINVFQVHNPDEHSLKSYMISLFDTTSTDAEKHINQYIEGMQVSRLPSESLDSHPGGVSSLLNWYKSRKAIEEEWTDVVVARVFPFGEMTAYIHSDWQCRLNIINGELVDHLRLERDRTDGGDIQLEMGTIVGVWAKDVKYKWKPLMETECLRGVVLGSKSFSFIGEGSNSWIIWAIDVGTLMYCDKVWALPDNLVSYEPLSSLCSLSLDEKGKEEKAFLLLALPLLIKALANKPSAAGNMLAFESFQFDHYEGDDNKGNDGGAFLALIEYPDSDVRIAFLKLMLSLVRNSAEIILYLLDCRFYMAICSRLEICIYFSSCKTTEKSFWCEVRLLVNVLTAIAEGSDRKMSDLPGWKYMWKVLMMWTEVNRDREKCLAAKCLNKIEKKNHEFKESPMMYLSSKEVSGSVMREDRESLDCIDWKPTFSGHIGASPEVRMKEAIMAGSEKPEPYLAMAESDDFTSDEDDDANVVLVNAVFQMANIKDYYIKGYEFNFSSDETHEISPEKSAQQISEITLAKTVCAFMNNGVGGSVYFGTKSKGKIEGLKITRTERDSFRKGIDRMMSRSIYPRVRPECYTIKYVPVLNNGEQPILLSSHKTWVIELHLKALPFIVYTVSSNQKCYVRKGKECVEELGAIIRQEAFDGNGKEAQKSVEELKAKLPKTKEECMLFIKEYLRKVECLEKKLTYMCNELTD